MRLLDGLKRLFRGPRSADSVAHDLAEGLRNGRIYLDHLEHEEGAKLADGEAALDLISTPMGEKKPSETGNPASPSIFP
jgi:hypothetical protein